MGPHVGRRVATEGRLMARHVEHTAFATSHPAVPALYVALTLALVMASMQPVLIGCALVGGLVYEGSLSGPRTVFSSLRWQLPLVLLVSVVNPLFVAEGTTVAFCVGSRPVYWESLWYGAAMGGMFVASIVWFRVAAALLPMDRVTALLANIAPIITLMISMSMRLIPRFVRQGRVVAAVHDVALPDARGKMATRMRLTSALMGWGLENSLETADAMRARGWGAARRRTTYARMRWTGRDAVVLAAVAAFGAIVALLAWRTTAAYAFYPTATPLAWWWGYVPYAAWMLIPTILHVREQRWVYG